jgi:hypothetical protein
MSIVHEYSAEYSTLSIRIISPRSVSVVFILSISDSAWPASFVSSRLSHRTKDSSVLFEAMARVQERNPGGWDPSAQSDHSK